MTSETRVRHHRSSDYCPRCKCQRECRVDRVSRRYLVTLPSTCPQGDECEREIMLGWDIAPSPQQGT